MCKYCDGSETPLARQETEHRDAEIRIDGNTLIADLRHDYLAAEIDFCPKCGNRLGEVKPLTVEQLAERVGKPYYHVSLQGSGNKWLILESHVARCPQDYHYGEYWLAFDREPKGEAE